MSLENSWTSSTLAVKKLYLTILGLAGCSKSLRALSLHIYLVSWTMVHNLLHVCSSMIWLTFCFFFIELSNDSCLLSFILFFSWTNCLHVFSCPHMCYVAWHIPEDAWKVLQKYLTKLCGFCFHLPHPNCAPNWKTRREQKRKMRYKSCRGGSTTSVFS